MRKRYVSVALALLLAGVVSGCISPVVRPTVDFTWCLDGSSGLLDYRFFSHSTTVPNHYITTLAWEFGDGTQTEESYWGLIHRFAEEGTYPVTLIVTDDRGISGTVTREVPVYAAAFIREWNLTLGFPVKITGVVENRHTENLQSVTVKAKFYDTDNIRLTDGTVKVFDLEPGEQALFTVKAQEYSSQIFYATVFVESFVADCPDMPYPLIENASYR